MIDTSHPTAAGDITIKALQINIGSGAELDARATVMGGTSGKISLLAIDDLAEFSFLNGISTSNFPSSGILGFGNVDKKRVKVTIDEATIRGGDVQIIATADSQHLLKVTDIGTQILDSILLSLESISFFVGVSKAKSVAKIKIDSPVDDTPTIIEAENFTAWSSAKVGVSAGPIAFGFGAALGIGITVADTEIGNAQITTTNDATIRSTTDHIVNVVAEVGALKKGAIGIAVSTLDSEATAHVQDDAVLMIGHDLFIQADTIDRNRTMARTTTGGDGVLGLSAAVSLAQLRQLST